MRRRSISRITVTLLGLMSLSAVEVLAGDPTQSVWVFTTERLPSLRRVDLATEVFVLDDIEGSLSALSFPYPGSEETARQHANALLNSPQGHALLDKIKRNAHAVTIAWQSGIEKLPAVLVDGRYVVYGDYDVASAIHRIERHRHGQ